MGESPLRMPKTAEVDARKLKTRSVHLNGMARKSVNANAATSPKLNLQKPKLQQLKLKQLKLQQPKLLRPRPLQLKLHLQLDKGPGILGVCGPNVLKVVDLA